MKLLLATTAFASFACATPLTRQQTQLNSEANDWLPILEGKDGATCAEVAVIFARGSLDLGNIGLWVGGPFRDALYAKFDSIAIQGVNASDYQASFQEYFDDDGQSACARSLGAAVDKYASYCPNTKFVISGWGQGALCARKSFDPSIGLVDINARDRVIAFAGFGNPSGHFENATNFPPLPVTTRSLAYCQERDPLCSDTSVDTIPADIDGFIDISSGKRLRWAWTPEHFFYNSMTSKAADDIFSVYQGV
ncbi:alpha/beta-hydrolase [Whalleya microplaca]|nr:alpha/beta-hydrolase [Whalleya microplaca]